jgi:hypothetical protein
VKTFEVHVHVHMRQVSQAKAEIAKWKKKRRREDAGEESEERKEPDLGISDQDDPDPPGQDTRRDDAEAGPLVSRKKAMVWIAHWHACSIEMFSISQRRVTLLL